MPGRLYGEEVDAWSIGAIVVYMYAQLFAGTGSCNWTNRFRVRLTTSTPFVWPSRRRLDYWNALSDRTTDLTNLEKVAIRDPECAFTDRLVCAFTTNCQNAGVDFVSRLLAVSPGDRMSVSTALRHAWLS